MHSVYSFMREKVACICKVAIDEATLQRVSDIGRKRTVITEDPRFISSAAMMPLPDLPQTQESAERAFRNSLAHKRTIMLHAGVSPMSDDARTIHGGFMRMHDPAHDEALLKAYKDDLAQEVQKNVGYAAEARKHTSHPYPIIQHKDFDPTIELSRRGVINEDLDARNRSALQNLVTMHEMEEGHTSQKLPTRVAGFNGHRGPEVLLREHNMLTTMPEELAPARNALRDVRALGESADFSDFGLQLGHGQRLSRHAVRRISDAVRTAKDVNQHVGFMEGLAKIVNKSKSYTR
jgi:hypothetical protein